MVVRMMLTLPLLIFGAVSSTATAFVTPQTPIARRTFHLRLGECSKTHRRRHFVIDAAAPPTRSVRGAGTALAMYNLPPPSGGGGGGGPGKQLKELLPGVLTIAGLVLFFASPLGSVFFFVTNSLLALAFLTPVVLLVGFQIWQFLNTTEAPCPSCGSPVRTLKDDGGQPTICLNCGSLVRVSLEGDGLELCNSPDGMFQEDDGIFGGAFDDLFGGRGAGEFVEGGDVLTGQGGKSREDERKNKTRRERTVIDVDVEVDKS